MSAHPGPLARLVTGLLWPDEPITRAAVLLLLGLAALAFVSVYGPLILRLLRIGQLRRAVQACFDDESSNAIQRQEVTNAFAESPLAQQWSDFVRRWHNAIAADPIQDASLPELSRAPVRLTDVLDEHPILPVGARRSLLPALPAIFLAAGLLGAFAGLVLALPDIRLSLDAAGFDPADRSREIAGLVDHLGMTLRVGLWGLLLSLAAAVVGRLIEGRADLQGEALDGWVQLAYGAISPGELATRTAHEQRSGLARLQEDMAELLRQSSGRPRPPIRSTAATSSTVGTAPSAEAIESGMTALVERIGRQLDRSVSEQLAALRESVAGTLERLATPSASSGHSASELALAVEHLVKTAESQSAASRSLTQTAHVLSDAATELRSGLDDFAGAVTQMRESSAALAHSSERGDGSQQATARAADALANSLARAEAVTREQQDRLDAGFSEVRDVVESVAGRLQEGLQTALASAIARVQEALASESRDTPASAAGDDRDEVAYALLREHAQLHRKTDGLAAAVAGLSESLAHLSAAVHEPRAREQTLGFELEGTSGSDDDGDLLDLDDEPEAAPPAAEAAEGAAPTPSPAPEPELPVTEGLPGPDPTSEADTVPYMKAPTPDMIYSAGERRAGGAVAEPIPPRSAAPRGAPPSSGTLSGLLRPTHHSGPAWSDLDRDRKVDPAATLRLEPRSKSTRGDSSDRDAGGASDRDAGGASDRDAGGASDRDAGSASDRDAGGASNAEAGSEGASEAEGETDGRPRPRGFFGRRK